MTVWFDVTKLRRPLSLQPFHALVLREFGEFTTRCIHMDLGLLTGDFVNAAIVNLRGQLWCQHAQVVNRLTFHFGRSGQVLIRMASRVAEGNGYPEPALEGGIKRSPLGGPDIPGLTRTWEGSKS